ncbi:MAG: GAF domain-containing SpoIIE family protein phosphatase [Flammeovirgaceae bacterium]
MFKVERAYNLEKDFYIEETINPDFYETGKSKYVNRHSELLQEIREELQILQEQDELNEAEIVQHIDDAVKGIDQFEIAFDSLVKLTVRRGFKSYGVEGDMRRAIGRVSNSGYQLDEAKVLSIRRSEKDYILRKDDTYVQQLLDKVKDLDAHVWETVKSESGRAYISNALEQYRGFFLELVELDQVIGFQKHTGLRQRLGNLSESLTDTISDIEEKVNVRANSMRQSIELVVIALFIVFIAINFMLSYFTTKSLSAPIERLSKGIHEVIESNFEAEPHLDDSDRRDEIGQLSEDFIVMLSKMKEHTSQIMRQQERLGWAYEDIQLLGTLGKDITSTLIIDEIIELVQHNLQQLMDATVFWIGVYNPKSDALDYRGGVLGKEQKAATFSQSILETDKLGVWCFKNEEEVIINDLDAEAELYKNFSSADGEQTKSIVYVPLIAKDKALGVFSVQHHDVNFFNEVRLNLIRSLASYTVVAIDNALIYQNQEELIEERTARIREQSEEIAAQKEKIQHSYENLAKTSQKVTASINYAKRIQEALLPNRKAIQKAFPESFVLFKPRDIVSGDFYWFNRKNDLTFLAALDCTGHGVPGAFMSMIGNELLNEAINRAGLTEPGQILEHMHKGVRKDLRQYETENRDGMDMVICTINKQNSELKFAGANNPIIYIQDDELFVIKGNRFPIGGKQREVERNYQQHTIDISKPTIFYLCSDGYQDQFGGRDGKKFMVKKFRKLLYAIHNLPMDEQKEILESTLTKWMNGTRQVDDILVMGIRV